MLALARFLLVLGVNWERFGSGKSYRLADGKIFATDILSMGIQRIFERPADFQKEDPEYFNFCLLVIDFTQ